MPVIATTTALSVTANVKSADQVTGTYQNIGSGRLDLKCKGSATGLNVTLLIDGAPVVNDLPIPFTGTAGTLSMIDNHMADAMVRGGRCELFFRNTTGGTLTVDSSLIWTPMATRR